MKWAIAIGVVLAGGLLVSLPASAATKPVPTGGAGKKKKGSGLDNTIGGENDWAWIQQMIADTRSSIETSGFPASVAFGQLAVETAYGTAGRGVPWGVKGTGDAGTVKSSTKEDFNLQRVTIEDNFAKYSSHAAAAKGYTDFLTGKRYKQGWHLRNDPAKWLLWLWGQGYASATNYGPAVVDASRHVANVTGDKSLEIVWTDEHRAISAQLSKVPFGTERRAVVTKLLGADLAENDYEPSEEEQTFTA